jgi:hypothetical protein
MHGTVNRTTSAALQEPSTSPTVKNPPAKKARRKARATKHCPKKTAALKGEVFDVQLAVMNNPDLDASTKASALLIILAIARPMKNVGECSYPSYATIAEITGFSKSFVIKIVKMLDAKGYVPTLAGSAGSGHSTHYRIGGSWDDDVLLDTAQKVVPDDLLPTPEKVVQDDLNSKEERS